MRINFNKNAKLHEICAIDGLRDSMEYVYFDEGNAVCSEGQIMAVFKIAEISTIKEEQIKLLEGKFIHRSAFKEMLKYDEILVESEFIIAKGKGFDVRLPLKSDVKYPNYKKVIAHVSGSKGSKERIHINSKLLDTLQSCVGSAGSIINMAIGEEGMIVNYPEKESYALIMPIMINE